MATVIAMMVGGALVNALAFSGSNFIFHKLDKTKADKERKRHDLATEKLNQDTETWNEERKKKLDFINSELMKRNIAEKDLSHMDEAMTLFNAVSKDSSYSSNSLSISPKPKLSDYYKPSEELQKYEYLWIIGGTIITAVIIRRFY